MAPSSGNITESLLEKMMQPEVSERIKNYINTNKSAADWMLASRKYPNLPAQFMATQIEVAKKVRKKLPLWSAHEHVFYPSKLAVEQCSSELTARYKAGLVRGQSITDLTGGLGVDSWFMTGGKALLQYVEPQEDLCLLVKHNFAELCADFDLKIYNTTAEEWLQSHQQKTAIAYIDPSRRSEGGSRLYSLADCMPDVVKLQNDILKKANQLLIKVSPLLDIKQSLTLLPQTHHVWVISVAGEVKELLFLLKNETPPTDVPVTAVLLHNQHEPQECTFTFKEEAEAERPLSLPLQYLYLPDAALLKAGAFKYLARRFGVSALHANTHLYTSDNCLTDFPGRVLKVERLLGNKKEVKKAFPDKKALIVSRNYPATPEQLAQKYGLQTGGKDYLVAATTLKNRPILLKAVHLS